MSDADVLVTPRVVVGVDGSQESKHALRWAATIAAAADAHLDVVAVWHVPSTVGLGHLPLAEDPHRDLDKALTAVVDEVFGAERPRKLRLMVREGLVADVLLHYGAHAVMIVVGCRGHGGFAGLRLGSVSRRVTEHATCPVLVVRGDRDPPALSV